MTETARTPNRLQHESSPYLQQHALNPVDWYPWGPEALETARSRNQPIFLSIGYSACHWCHVMEHESFEHADIAAAMNQHFVNIKVDREERPDLDQIYMNAVVAMTGQGGWPMSVFLTPDLKPFYGGTYWPPEPKFGRPGFAQVVAAVADAWANRGDAVRQQAGQLTETVAEMSQIRGPHSELTVELLTESAAKVRQYADRTHGGFGGAPKFPHPFDLRVLLRDWRRHGNPDSLGLVELTLNKMADGGIYDHLGGGFHRYSTDARWLVPHFEKMLYDNALLVPVYLEAWQATGQPRYREVAEDTLNYVLKEMTQPAGGFYSTQDADSEGEEGRFFVWTVAEIQQHLGQQRADVFMDCYDVSPAGNWEGRTILNRVGDWTAIAAKQSLTEKQLHQQLAEDRQTLFAARSQRVKPGRDDKVLTSWNGLMIAAMSLAGRILEEPKYTAAAADAAEFLVSHLRDENDRLLHAYKDGQAKLPAYLDDYACLIDGLIELFQSSQDLRWLREAERLADDMVSLFGDADDGGFFYTATDHEELIVRQKDGQDNATPSGNAMAATALLKLSRLLGEARWQDQAVRTLESLSPLIAKAPSAAGQALMALDFLLGPTFEVVLHRSAQQNDKPDPDVALQSCRGLFTHFASNHVLLVLPDCHAANDQDEAKLPGNLAELIAGKSPSDSEPTLYLCQTGQCDAPVAGGEAVNVRLEQL